MNRASASPPASSRTRAAGARALGLTALAALSLSTWACTLSQNGVVPPSDTFFYPTSGAMRPLPVNSLSPIDDPAAHWLYVANSNADLRFNDGTLVMANVGAEFTDDAGSVHPGAETDRATPGRWGVCPQADYVNPLSRNAPQDCCWDVLDSNILNCDERRYIQSDATVLIGSFAAQMVWQSYCDDPCRTYHGTMDNPLLDCLADSSAGRLLVGVRGNTSLTYVDVVPNDPNGTALRPAFHCTGDVATTPMAECNQTVTDTSSSLAIESGDPQAPAVALPDEPYALTLDDDPKTGRGYLYVGHLVGSTSSPGTGGVSLFDVSGTGFIAAPGFPPAPRFIAPFGSPFPPSSSGLFGVTALKMHVPLGADPSSGQQLFVSSRYVPLVSSMVPIGPNICAGDQNDDVIVPAGNTLNSNLVGSEMRGVEFIDPPLAGSQPNQPNYAQRAYALQRVPPALVGFDIAINNAGTATATPTDVLETCSSPTFLYQHTVPGSDEGPRLYVNCFDTGEVYIFDPSGPTLLTTLAVGRGPGGMVFDVARPLAYVLDFSQNDVSVVDLAPKSPTQYHVIQRLGFPSVTPR